MSLSIVSGNGGGSVGSSLCTISSRHHRCIHLPQFFAPLASTPRRSSALHIVSAAKKLSSRTGRFDSKNRRSSVTTKEQDEDEERSGVDGGAFVENTGLSADGGEIFSDDGVPMPKLPGEEPDFWEGPKWDGLGFFVQYMWAFGVLFALVACGIAAFTYNEGATDFKETSTYKESIQSQELLGEPGASNTDVFESNPTEVAPSLE